MKEAQGKTRRGKWFTKSGRPFAQAPVLFSSVHSYFLLLGPKPKNSCLWCKFLCQRSTGRFTRHIPQCKSRLSFHMQTVLSETLCNKHCIALYCSLFEDVKHSILILPCNAGCFFVVFYVSAKRWVPLFQWPLVRELRIKISLNSRSRVPSITLVHAKQQSICCRRSQWWEACLLELTLDWCETLSLCVLMLRTGTNRPVASSVHPAWSNDDRAKRSVSPYKGLRSRTLGKVLRSA